MRKLKFIERAFSRARRGAAARTPAATRISAPVLAAAIALTVSLTTTPQTLAAGEQYVDLVSGARHSCALAESGDVQCWGRERMGGDRWPLVSSDVWRRGSITRLFKGTHQGFVITSDGDTLCFGENDVGQCDVLPDQLDPIAGADRHACGLTTGSVNSLLGR